MRLWSIQPISVYETINKEGVYRCDPKYVEKDSIPAYNWLVTQMSKKIGYPPQGVTYPVWAIHTWYGKRAKPDFRRFRWEWGISGETYACIEVEIPDETVVLSDYDAWHSVLNNYPLTASEEEFESLDNTYDPLSEQEKKIFREKSWKGIFDISQDKTDWFNRGAYVQATFWELKKEQIKNITFFKSMAKIL